MLDPMSALFLEQLFEDISTAKDSVKYRLKNRKGRSILVVQIEFSHIDCTYRSDSPYLQCAVNPSGDCRTCQFREP
jgi:Family of unknown function (DUF6464)